MKNNNSVYQAVMKIGGATAASIFLQVNSNTIYKWIKRGSVPRFDKAVKLAKASGYAVEVLRPVKPVVEARYE